MKVWTFLEFYTKVTLDLDIQDEPFVSMDEFIGYTNESIEEAEAEICKISEDYFLTDPATITMVNGQQEYSLPTDIYIQKIRNVIYHNGAILYPVTKMRGMYPFLEEELLKQFGPLEYYQYRITSPSANTYKLRLFPTSREDGAFLFVHYLRSAALIPTLASGASQSTINATQIDIPEFAQFLLVFVKAKIKQKENNGIMPADQVALVQQQRSMMVDTLTERIPDDDNVVIGDYSSYWEHN